MLHSLRGDRWLRQFSRAEHARSLWFVDRFSFKNPKFLNIVISTEVIF
jgi:hypothetical protein